MFLFHFFFVRVCAQILAKTYIGVISSWFCGKK